MAINDKMSRVFVSHPSQVRCFKASEIEDGSKSLILNKFLKESDEIKFGDIKEGFISFKGLKANSKIFQEGGFLEKIGTEGQDYINSGNPVFYNGDELAKIKDILEGDESVCIHPVIKLCLTNVSVTGSKDTTDIVTFCGFSQAVSPVAKFEVSIGSNLEIMESCDGLGFYDLLFKEFFNTFDYDKNQPNGFVNQANAEDFLWIVNFQNKSGDCICNHWLTFKAKITSAGISRDASNSISDFSPTLAVQGGIAHEKNCENMVIFGDKDEKKKIKSKCEQYQDKINNIVIDENLDKDKRALALANDDESLKAEALLILDKEKTRAQIIAFIANVTSSLECSSDVINKINSAIASRYSKKEKSHFDEWKQLLDAALTKPEPVMEEVATAIIFERNLATEWQYKYAEAIFKKQVKKDAIRSFVFEYSYEVQRDTEEAHNKIADEITAMLRDYWNTEGE